MRVSAKKANSTTTDVVLEIRMTEEEAMIWVAIFAAKPLKSAAEAVIKEHLQTRFRVSRVVGS